MGGGADVRDDYKVDKRSGFGVRNKEDGEVENGTGADVRAVVNCD